MSDLHARLEEARGHVETEWTPERQRRAKARLDHALLVRTRRTGMALAAVVVCAVALFIGLRHRTHAPALQQATPVAKANPELLFRLHDGTTVSSVAPKTRVDTVVASSDEVVLRVASGEARFDVAHQKGRQFHVVAGQVRVTVIGTRFTVSNTAGGVRVRVERGHVRVDWPAGSIQLYAGEERWVPRSVTRPSAPAPKPQEEATAPRHSAPLSPPASAPAPRPKASWRDLAQSGEYERAYHRLVSGGSGAVRDEPGDLLLAADVARLGGHPADAVKYLQSVVSAHAGDARAPLAAFTLGRVLLDDLGRPRPAAQAFATALRLAPHGALAQDALAREVEAWSHAGESALAHERAEQYLKEFPKGRRAAAVRQFGGVE